jgi:hypothetical protein
MVPRVTDDPNFLALLRPIPMTFRAFSSLLALTLCAVAAHAAEAAAPVLADLDPENDDLVGPPSPIEACEAKLHSAGVEFTWAQLPVRPANAEHPTCGVEQAVVYRRGPAKIRYNSPPLLSCGMALGLARFEQALSEEGPRYLGQHITRIEHGGTYNCRKMARFALVSEHSYANAIDIKSVTLENGRKLTVLGSFGKLDVEPQQPEARFWRAVTRRVYDEGAFSVVITPFFDALHKDHIHLDQAHYRVDGSRPAP